MTKITNRQGLPVQVVQALERFQRAYDRGDSDYTVTELLKPAYMCRLEREHAHELERDVGDSMWALLGSAMHSILEPAPEFTDGLMTEERIYATVCGKKVSAQVDAFDMTTGVLTDYKCVSVWKAMLPGGWDDYIKQVQWQACLLRRNGYTVNRAQLMVLYRDWRPADAQRKAGEGYPSCAIGTVDVDVSAVDSDYRLTAAVEQRAVSEYRPCNPQERWARPTKWAAYRTKTAVRATKLCDTESEAREVAGATGRVEHRPGEDVRCGAYCLVSKWCAYAKVINGQGDS